MISVQLAEGSVVNTIYNEAKPSILGPHDLHYLLLLPAHLVAITKLERPGGTSSVPIDEVAPFERERRIRRAASGARVGEGKNARLTASTGARVEVDVPILSIRAGWIGLSVQEPKYHVYEE